MRTYYRPRYFGSEVIFYINGDGPPVSVCGARRILRLTKQACFLPTAAHAAPSLHPPPAALGLAAIPNTEVKHMCADNTWRAMLRCPVCALPPKRLCCTPTAATRSPPSSRHRRQSARSSGKIGNANTETSYESRRFFVIRKSQPGGWDFRCGLSLFLYYGLQLPGGRLAEVWRSADCPGGIPDGRYCRHSSDR